MAHMDVFTNDAFSVGQMVDTAQRVPYVPGMLGSMNLFTPKPVRTEFFTIEERDGKLAIIQTTKRGSPPVASDSTKRRRIRRFDTVRVADGDRISASEIAGVRAFGSETELMQIQDLVVDKMSTLRTNMEVTHEWHRLGALQGKLFDADGTLIFDYFSEFNGIGGGTGVAPTDIAFALNTPTTDIATLINASVLRPMMRASVGAWIPNRTAVGALCGDSFYDKLTHHATVISSYNNWQAAEATRKPFGVSNVDQSGTFAAFYYGGVYWYNYRGADNFDGVTPGIKSLGVATNKAKFFPINAPGVFQVGLSPGETFDWVNTPGQETYSMLVPDLLRNSYVDVEMYSYPLYICTRPEMLLAGTV